MADDITLPKGYENYTPVDTSAIKLPGNYKLFTQPPVPAVPQDMFPSGKDMLQAFPEAAASLLPMAGAEFGAPGVLAGSFGKQALQGFFPKVFGEGPQNLGDVATNTGLDFATQFGIPKLLGKLFSSAPAVRNALESNRVETNAGQLESKFLTNPELETLPESNYPPGASRGSAGQFTENPSSFAKSYNQTVRAGQNEMNSLVAKGYSPSTKSLDAPKILDEMIQNPDQYQNIDPIRKNSLREFLTAVSKQKSLSAGSGMILSYEKKRLAFDLTPILLGAAGGNMEAGVGGAAALIVGDKVLSKLMENPNIAHLAVRAVQTGFDSPESPLLTRVLMYSLRGTEATMLVNGKEQKVIIGQDGLPQPASK